MPILRSLRSRGERAHPATASEEEVGIENEPDDSRRTIWTRTFARPEGSESAKDYHDYCDHDNRSQQTIT